jgi:serine protease 16
VLPFKRLRNAAHHRIMSGNVGMAQRVADVPDQWYTQQLDHFEYSNTTWKQRYWTSKEYYTGGDAPLLVYINGEGEGSPRTVSMPLLVQLAQQHGSLIVSLEHRFYGKSQPFGDTMTTDQLRLLSSQQALADLATFIEWFRAEHDIPASAKVVTFGGSYFGAFVAWSRLKYPAVVDAAWASSGPVHAIYEMTQYFDVVTASVSDPVVGGSHACQSALREVFQQVSDYMTNASGLDALAEAFGYCPVTSPSELDLWNIASATTDALATTVQYNLQVGYSVAGMCSKLLGGQYPTAFAAYAQYSQSFNAADEAGECVDVTYDTMVATLRDTSSSRHDVGVGDRQWTYQTCAQFGYFQTCDASTTCVGPKNIDIDGFAAICQDVFGISGVAVQDRIDFTQSFYGSNTTLGTQTVHMDGTIDPWHSLAIISNVTASPSSPAWLINGTSHCFDLSGQGEAVDAARAEGIAALNAWL